MPITDVDFVFNGEGVIAGFRKDVAADVLIGVRRIFVGVADPKKVAVGEFVEDAALAKKMMDGSRNVFVHRAELIFRVNDGLHGIKIAIERQKERGFLVAAERAAQGTFVILPGFGGFLDGEGVCGVEDSVAVKEIDGAMKIRSSGLGSDFKAGASGIGKEYGVRVLIDADFLDSRGSDARTVGFDAVYDERDAVGGCGVVVEEAGKGGDVVLVEDRNAIKSVAFKGVCALVFRGFGADLRSGVGSAHGDGLRLRSKCKSDANKSETF